MNTKAKFAYVYMIGGLVVFLISILVLINDKFRDLKNSDSENPQSFLKKVNLTVLLIDELKLKLVDSYAHHNEIEEEVYYFWFCDLRRQFTSSLLSSTFYSNIADNSKKSSTRIQVVRASFMKNFLGFFLCSLDTFYFLFLSVFVVLGFFILLYGCVRFYKYDIKMLHNRQRASLVSNEKSNENENEQADKVGMITKLGNQNQVNTIVETKDQRKSFLEETVDKIRRIARNTRQNCTKTNLKNNNSEINQQEEISSQDYIELITSNKEKQCDQNTNSTNMTDNNLNTSKNIINCSEKKPKRKEEEGKKDNQNEKECPFIYEELPVFMVKNKDYLVNSNIFENNSPMFASNLSLANELNNKSEMHVQRSINKKPFIQYENRRINKDEMVLISSSRLHLNPNLSSNSRYFSLTNPNLHIEENFPSAKINWSTFGLNQLNSRFYNLPNEETVLSKRLVSKVRNRKYSKSFKNRNKKSVANNKMVSLNDSFLLNNFILQNDLNDLNNLERIYSLRLKALNSKLNRNK